MANFSKLVLTNKGKALVAKNYAGQATIEFLKMQTSSHSYTLDDIPALTALENVKQESLISSKKIYNYCQIAVEAPFTNSTVEDAYYLRCIGLIAIDPDEGEILYAVTVEQSGGIYIASATSEVVTGMDVKLIATVGTAYDVDLTVSPVAIATAQSVIDLEDDLNDHVGAAVTDANGVHGIRYHNTKIQVYDTDEEDWIDVEGGGGIRPVLTVNVTTGSTITCSNGDVTLTGESVEGSCQFSIPVLGNWNVYATLNGQTSDTQVVSVTGVQEYSVSLSYYSASLLVTAPSGATVTLTKPDSTTTSLISTGTVSFALTTTGNYSVVATIDGISSETKTITVEEETTSYTETLTFITLTVTIESGASVTVSKGADSYTAISDGTCEFLLPSTGTWSVSGSHNSQTTSDTVVIGAYTDYTIRLAFYQYYGLKIAIANSDPTSACTYIDDAEGMSTGYEAWKDTPIFKGIKACLVKDGVRQYYLKQDNLAYKEDGTAATINSTSAGDVMVEVPKIGYKMTTDGTYHYVYLTDDPAADGYCYKAHALDTEGDCDYIYYGAYLGYNSGSKLYSISGQAPTGNVNLTNFRTYAQARGTGYQLLSFYPLTLLQCLYLMMYKNRNSQAALGYGYVGGSAKINTGHANAAGVCYGNTNSQTDSKGMCFMNIEDFWGNLNQWVDGIYSDESRNIKTDFKNFSDTGSGYSYTKASGVNSNIGNYMSDIVGTNEGGFVPKAVSGGSTTYYADYADLSASCCAYFGGSWSNGDAAGAFRFNVDYSASYTISSRGARLMFKHKAA